MWIFPKNMQLGTFWPQAQIRSKFPRIFQQTTAYPTTKARGNAKRPSASAAQQHNTHAVIATLSLASVWLYPQPSRLINLRVLHHQERWRWSEASRSRGAACLYELFIEEKLTLVHLRRSSTHTAHNTPLNKNNTTQHTDYPHLNSQPNYPTTSRWETPTSFLLPWRSLRSESCDSDIVRCSARE